jgi:hypothetical protein
MLVQVHQHLILELENDKDVLCDVYSSFSTLELENLQKLYTHLWFASSKSKLVKICELKVKLHWSLDSRFNVGGCNSYEQIEVFQNLKR